MTLPNFLIIGAAKSGTTAIYAYIKQHPEIFMSQRRELQFFSKPTHANKDVPEKYIIKGVTTLKEYKSFFDGVTNEKVIGESSPMYLYTPDTAEHIKRIIPNAKLLAILRNPVNRAYSAFTHGIRDWNEPCPTFEEALKNEPERINAGWGMLWHYTNAGFYYQQLNRYYQIFDREQIKVVLYDDLVEDVTKLLREIFSFLEVDPDFVPDTSARPNISGFPKNKTINSLLKSLFNEDNLIKSISRFIFPRTFRWQAMKKIKELNLEKRQMPSAVYTQLQNLFLEDIQMLEALIDRDLSHWIA